MEKILKFKNFLQEFSIPLIAGVLGGVVYANFVGEDPYHHLVDLAPFGEGVQLFGHTLTIHFLINDIFMVLFFGIAAKEITESVLPGGSLNPMKKAINPLLGTIGGVAGPALTYVALTMVFFGGTDDYGVVANGWGIPTATDIALAWLVARLVFGASHPAVNFLLLLAVADDAIGLGIIAVFYPDPSHPVHPEYLGVTAIGMGVAYIMRRLDVQSWVPYIAIGGTISWCGLMLSSLHPALALVFIVPFLPGPKTDTGMFNTEDELTPHDGHDHGDDHSPLHNFEHQVKLTVDFGLFFFGFANAGVAFASVNVVTWIVLASLVFGKVIGITLCSWAGSLVGFPMPNGMGVRHLIVASLIAGLGLTVALFVAGQAFPGPPFQGPAKMGAVFSGGVAALAIVVGKLLNAKSLAGSSGTPVAKGADGSTASLGSHAPAYSMDHHDHHPHP